MPLNLSPDKVGFNERGDGPFSLPFDEQIKFFKAKKALLLPTEHWDDITGAAHDRAFMVAGAMKADLLSDFHGAIEKAIAEGKTLDWFRKEFATIVQKHGWDYTGAFDWRSRVIYQTNLQASYQAGRYAQLTHPDLLKHRPWWKYVHNDSVANPRPLHVKWSGLTLRHDDPWWQAHFPPQGFGCKCRITAVAEPNPDKSTAPDDGTYDYVDRWGEKHEVPVGVDYGWGYMPGANTQTPLRQFVQDKLIGYRPAIGKALTKDVNRYINAEASPADFAKKALADTKKQEPLWLGFVENVDALNAVAGTDVTGYMVLLPADAVRHVEAHHAFDGKGQRPARPEDYREVWQVLAEPDSIKAGSQTKTGRQTIIATKTIGGEVFRCVFEVLGKKIRAVSLLTLAIKT